MPLHRSILFWLGLFVLSFLLWAWADSRQKRSYVIHDFGFGPGENGYSFSAFHAHSLIQLWYTKSFPDPNFPGPAPSQNPYTLRDRREAPRGQSMFPAPKWVVNDDPGMFNGGKLTVLPTRTITLSLPHWLIILVYLISFTAILRYRARRRRQLLPADPPQAPTD